MKTKIFKGIFLAALSLAALTGAAAQSGNAAAPAKPAEPAESFNGYELTQTNTKEYRDKMQKLQEQMRDLQKQMNKLSTDEMKKSSEALKEAGKKLKSLRNFNYNSEYDVSGSSKNLGVAPNGGTNNTYLGRDGDDYIAKKVKSGEVKEKTKSYSKSYSIDRDDKIQIDNTYGRVTIVTWAKNEVKVEVQIKADADEEDDAQKLLDEVAITDSKSESTVQFRTNIDRGENNNSNWGTWLSGGKSHVHKVEVNYTVYMPAKNQLSITNKFGGVTMPDLGGKVSLNLSYGTLNAQQLSNPLNDITIKFGDANIESLNSDALSISYGAANIGTADKLKARVNYSSLNVDRLKSSGDVTVKYSKGGYGFKVGELDKNLKTLNVDASFSKVFLNAKDDFDFDVSTKMGSFTYDNDGAVNITSKTPADGERGFSFTKTYKGHAGKGNSDKSVTIKSSYTQVKLD